MAMNFIYESNDLKVVQHWQSEEWFVLDLNEGDVISKPFATREQAETEMELMIDN